MPLLLVTVTSGISLQCHSLWPWTGMLPQIPGFGQEMVFVLRTSAQILVYMKLKESHTSFLDSYWVLYHKLSRGNNRKNPDWGPEELRYDLCQAGPLFPHCKMEMILLSF